MQCLYNVLYTDMLFYSLGTRIYHAIFYILCTYRRVTLINYHDLPLHITFSPIIPQPTCNYFLFSYGYRGYMLNFALCIRSLFVYIRTFVSCNDFHRLSHIDRRLSLIALFYRMCLSFLIHSNTLYIIFLLFHCYIA